MAWNSANNKGISDRSGVRSSFWDYLSLLSSNLVLIPLGMISVTLTTRILGREGYGYLTVYSLVTNLMLMVTTNWTAAALIRFGREEYDQRERLNYTFWARTIILIPCLFIGIIAVYLFRTFITDYMGMPHWTVWLVIGSLLLLSVRNYLDYILQAIHRMKTYAWIQIVFTLVSITGLILIFVGVFEKTYLNVIIVGLFTSAITTVFLCFLLVPGRILLPMRTDQKMLREVFFFSYPIIVGNLAAYLVNWIDVMVIKHYSAMSDVGGYQLAYNVFNLLVGLIASINVLMAPILVSLLAAKREDLVVRYSTRLVPQGFLLWAAIIGVGISICPQIFRIIFGREFIISATYFQFLALGLILTGPLNFYSGVITAYKLIKLAVIASVARGLVNLIGDLLLVPNIGPMGAAIATTGGVGVAAILYLLICQHRLKERLLWQLTLALPAFLSLGVSHFVSSWWSPFIASGVTLAVGYCLAKAFHLFRYEDLALLDYIQMPTLLKKVIAWVYSFLANKENTLTVM